VLQGLLFFFTEARASISPEKNAVTQEDGLFATPSNKTGRKSV
jgi:hypothetical protein